MRISGALNRIQTSRLRSGSHLPALRTAVTRVAERPSSATGREQPKRMKSKRASKQKRPGQFAEAHGSALACKIADALMTNGHGQKARRLQLRDEDEKDLGGYCRQAVLWLIDKELDADALARSKPALFRKIRRILKAPNDPDQRPGEQSKS